VLNWLWLRPKKLEKLLREQGLQGNPYKILLGDTKDLFKMEKEARSKPMNLSDDIAPRVIPYTQQSVKIHGMFELCCLNLSNITLHWSLIVKLFNK
jgi:hypothetical protein